LNAFKLIYKLSFLILLYFLTYLPVISRITVRETSSIPRTSEAGVLTDCWH